MWILKGCKVHNYLICEDLSKIGFKLALKPIRPQGGVYVFCTAGGSKKPALARRGFC
jgi:hypothetical protein